MIGLVSCYEVYNYGSHLMSYALQRQIGALGIEYEHIQYIPIHDWHYFKAVPHKLMNKQLREHKRESMNEIRDASQNNKRALSVKSKQRAFDEFAKKYFPLSDALVGYNELCAGASKYQAVILGSDQVWGPMNLEGDFKNLIFVPDSIPKVVYGASFGVDDIPRNQLKRTKRYLARIEHISVREVQGNVIIKALDGRDVPVVLDPTLLFSIDEWSDIIDERLTPREPYIFTYFLGDQKEYREEVIKLKRQTGLKVYSIDSYSMDEIPYADVRVDEAGPSEFVSLIKNAEYICTDSFHGTVFSILSHKKFKTFFRYSDAKIISANSRVISLLQQLDLMERIYKSEQWPESIFDEIRYENVEKRLNTLREKSKRYLCNALESVGVL